jgi:phosphate-selective porin OprO and OprP
MNRTTKKIALRIFTSLVVTWFGNVALPAQSAGARSGAAVGGTNVAPVVVASVESVNELRAQQAEQAELLRKLQEQFQSQLQQLEQQKAAAAEQAKAQAQTHQAEVEKLLGKIGELQGKVESLESGRVLPEIALTPQDGPTTAEVDQKIRVLARQNELAAEAAEAKAKELPRLSAGASGFSLSSADTNYVLKLRGLAQADSRTFFGDNSYLEGNDTFTLRRARIILEGKLARDFEFQLTPDFAGNTATLLDAWVNYQLRPELQVRVGKFKGPVGLENLQADAVGAFNERGLPSTLVPTRNVGLQLGGELGRGVASYAVGIYNNTGDSRNSANSDFNDDKEFAGRIFLQPFHHSDIASLRGLGFGVAGSFSQINSNAAGLPGNTGGTLPGYTTTSLQQFFAYNPLVGTVVADGDHWRLAPHLTYYYGPFGLLGEYTVSERGVQNSATAARAQLQHTAWQISAQWVLTGEPASFTGIKPARPFDLRSGGWGAWQLVGRVGQLKIDDEAFNGFANQATSASEAFSWGVGLNWWLNQNVRVLTSFSHTRFDGGGQVNPLIPGTLVPPGTVTAEDELAFLTRVQISF